MLLLKHVAWITYTALLHFCFMNTPYMDNVDQGTQVVWPLILPQHFAFEVASFIRHKKQYNIFFNLKHSLYKLISILETDK